MAPVLVISALLAASGAILALLGWLGRRGADGPHCTRCGYPADTTIDNALCPECGAYIASNSLWLTLAIERPVLARLYRLVVPGGRRRSPALVTTGGLLVLAGVAGLTSAAVALDAGFSLHNLRSSRTLIASLQASAAPENLATHLAELRARDAGGRLTPAESRALAQIEREIEARRLAASGTLRSAPAAPAPRVRTAPPPAPTLAFTRRTPITPPRADRAAGAPTDPGRPEESAHDLVLEALASPTRREPVAVRLRTDYTTSFARPQQQTLNPALRRALSRDPGAWLDNLRRNPPAGPLVPRRDRRR